jgi:acetyl-CoA acetyltransferase
MRKSIQLGYEENEKMAESIKDKVAIIGMGCTKFGELWDQDAYDLVIDASYDAFDDAGVGPAVKIIKSSIIAYPDAQAGRLLRRIPLSLKGLRPIYGEI